ncbi:MAG TPA: helix-turn-helix domain-containing protein [Candidatus Eubacterium faecavium]|nr:helix-turn-helix domain-containing protein [Candidatus Eubacterium faecavium]
MEYYEILKQLRIDNDLYQKDIAKVLKIDQQYYSKYERGINEMPIRHLRTLCIFYGVSADYILGLPEGLKYIKR